MWYPVEHCKWAYAEESGRILAKIERISSWGRLGEPDLTGIFVLTSSFTVDKEFITLSKAQEHFVKSLKKTAGTESAE